MWKIRSLAVLSLALVLVTGGVFAADGAVKRGLKPGEPIPGSFEPLNVTGAHAGELHCLVCEYGLDPVIMIFAREVDDDLVKLLSAVDAVTARHRDRDLNSFVVVLSDRKDLDKQLHETAKKHAFKQ